MLAYVVDAFKADPEREVYLVPVSIVYDQQHEVEAISREETGVPKDPESLRLLLSFARAQSRRRGRAYIRFGEPLSLRGTMEGERDLHLRASHLRHPILLGGAL